MSNSKIISAVIISIGLVAAAVVMACAIRDFKAQDRYVTVKGLSERQVKSDLATWSLSFDISGDDLSDTLAQARSKQATVIEFLTKGGLDQSEITVGTPSVFDRQAQTYNAGDDAKQKRFVIKSSLAVRTEKVEALKALSLNVADLIEKGIVFSQTGCPDPAFSFTRLNDIKADMLSESMQNTRAAAEKFAQDSESRVGRIRRANQGVFSIQSSSQANRDGGDYCGVDINKNVRLVTTVDYFLKN